MDLLITTDIEELVPVVQSVVESRLNTVAKAVQEPPNMADVGRGREAPAVAVAGVPLLGGPNGRPLAEPDIATRRVPKGILVTLTFVDPNSVRPMENEIERWVVFGRGTAEIGLDARRILEGLRLLFGASVQLAIQAQPDGAIIVVTSNDPYTAERIRQEIPRCCEILKAWTKTVERAEGQYQASRAASGTARGP